jgi:hypothetical protein
MIRFLGLLGILALIHFLTSCVQVPTTNGNATVFGNKASNMVIADHVTGQVVFAATDLDQTDPIKFLRDGYIANQLFGFLRSEVAATAATDQAAIASKTDIARSSDAVEKTRILETEKTARAALHHVPVP